MELFNLKPLRRFPQEYQDPRPFSLSSPFSLPNVWLLFFVCFLPATEGKSTTPQSGVWTFGANMAGKVSPSE